MPCDWREAWDRLAGLLAGRLRELFALVFCAFCLGSAAAAVPTALPLGDAQSAFDAEQLIGQIWVDPAGTATLDQVLQPGKAAFQPNRTDNIYSLGEHGALWYHLRLVRARGERHGWVLAFPMPALDAVTVYQQTPPGAGSQRPRGTRSPSRHGRSRAATRTLGWTCHRASPAMSTSASATSPAPIFRSS